MHQSKLDSFLDWMIIILSWGGFLYHMMITQILITSAIEHQIIHLAFVLLILYLTFIRKSKSNWVRVVFTGLVILSLFGTGYVKVFYDYLETIIGFPEPMDMAVGFILLLLVIVGSWIAFGPVLPVMTIIFIFYFFLGHLLPSPLYHAPISLPYGISYLDIGLSGLFGNLLGIMANFGLLFMVFGALLETGGANSFFLEVGKTAGRVLAGGPAHTAVVGSALVGSVTGAAVANVIVTGSFTIPMMKKIGYKPEMAGAIEATASTGSQLMPPIMGSGAFIMAGVLGISYVDIMVAAIVPALLYFFAVCLNVQIIAKKTRIIAPKEPIDKKRLFETAPIFIIPLSFLILFLLIGKSPGYTVFYAILLIAVLSCIRKSTRPSFSQLSQGIVRGFLAGAKVSIVVGAIAILAQIFITTGLAQKLSFLVEMLSGGNLVLTLLWTMALCILLGCGLPASAAYALVGILVAPTLVRMGVVPIQAHFFVFYYAIISAVTPPVALATLAAASIAKSNFWKTGMEAFKLSISGLIVPFFIIYNSALILKPVNVVSGILSIISIMIGITLLASVLYGYLFYNLTAIERVALTLPILSLFGFAFNGNYSLLLGGLSILFCISIWQLKAQKKKSAYERSALASKQIST